MASGLAQTGKKGRAGTRGSEADERGPAAGGHARQAVRGGWVRAAGSVARAVTGGGGVDRWGRGPAWQKEARARVSASFVAARGEALTRRIGGAVLRAPAPVDGWLVGAINRLAYLFKLQTTSKGQRQFPCLFDSPSLHACW